MEKWKGKEGRKVGEVSRRWKDKKMRKVGEF